MTTTNCTRGRAHHQRVTDPDGTRYPGYALAGRAEAPAAVERMATTIREAGVR